MLRSILAVVAGFMIWTVLWLGSNSILSITMARSFKEDGSTDSTGILVLLLVLSVIFSLIAGYLTARLALTHKMRQALILGIILLAVGFFVQTQFWALFPLWYHLGFLMLLIPATYAGAKMLVKEGN